MSLDPDVEIVIRCALREDAESISALIIATARKFILFEFSAQGQARFLAAHTVKEIERRMRAGFAYDVALYRGELVGVVGMRNSTHLYHLFVDEAHQRRGIGHRLWEHAKSRCLRGDHPGFFTVNASRFAVPIYERMGFTAVGPVQSAGGILFVPMRLP